MLRQIATGSALALVVSLLLTAPATASHSDCKTIGGVPVCVAADHGSAGGGNPGGGNPGAGNPGTGNADDESDATPASGVRNGDFCQRKAPVDPQPGPTDPIWGGRDPETSTLVRCFFAGQSGPDGLPWIDYVVGADEPDAGPAVDPAVLAQTAMERLQLEPVQVGMVPQTTAAAPASMGLVGLPVWMWVADPSESTFGPAALTVSAGAVSVSLTAQVERVEWSMGDGTTVTCTGPGTAYDPGRGAQQSPDCGHVYTTTSRAAGGSFPVTATSYWVASWTSSTGASGVLETQQVADAQVRIGESQVVVTGP